MISHHPRYSHGVRTADSDETSHITFERKRDEEESSTIAGLPLNLVIIIVVVFVVGMLFFPRLLSSILP